MKAAFPRAAGPYIASEQGCASPSQEGMTLREYFAAHAPDCIPEWFVHVQPPRDYPPMPDYLKLDEAHQQTALSWQRDGCFDLPEEIVWFGEKVTAHRQGKADWEDANCAARYFQWRWAYADGMIAEGVSA